MPDVKQMVLDYLSSLHAETGFGWDVLDKDGEFAIRVECGQLVVSEIHLDENDETALGADVGIIDLVVQTPK